MSGTAAENPAAEPKYPGIIAAYRSVPWPPIEMPATACQRRPGRIG
jgi:hypothetical protein